MSAVERRAAGTDRKDDGQFFVHTGRIRPNDKQHSVTKALLALKNSILGDPDVQTLVTKSRFEHLSYKLPAHVKGATIDRFVTTKSALLEECSVLGDVEAADNLILAKCPKIGSVKAGGILFLIASKLPQIHSFRELYYLPSVNERVAVSALSTSSQVSIEVSPEKKDELIVAPPPPPPPPPRKRNYCRLGPLAIAFAVIGGISTVVYRCFFANQEEGA